MKGPGQGCELSCPQDHQRLEGRSHTAAAETDSRAPWRRLFLPVSVYVGGDLSPRGHLATLGEIFVVARGGGGVAGHLVGRGQKAVHRTALP